MTALSVVARADHMMLPSTDVAAGAPFSIASFGGPSDGATADGEWKVYVYPGMDAREDDRGVAASNVE